MTGAKSTGTPGQMRLFTSEAAAPGEDGSAFAAVAAAFDPCPADAGASVLAGLTKKAIAQELGVSAVAVGQWESGTHPPRPDHVGRLAEVLRGPSDLSCWGADRTPGWTPPPRTSAACAKHRHTSGPRRLPL